MELLFRGRTKNGDWLEGGFFSWPSGKCMIVTCNRDGAFVISNDNEVLPESLGMYIGMNDKLGNKIFGGIGTGLDKGGDIIKVCLKGGAVEEVDYEDNIVKYDDKAFRFYLCFGSDTYGFDQTLNCEIIGKAYK